MHAWTDGYEISEVNKSKTKKKNRTLPQRKRRGEKIGVGKAACRLHLDGDEKLAISKCIE